MNYRHAFHAGNFADVLKHAVLARILVYLTEKPTPLRYIDTHAGIGWYNLDGAEAIRTGEWQSGIGRLQTADAVPDILSLLAPYLEAVGLRDATGKPTSYPGSPAVAQHLLRADDKLLLCELHPEDAAWLRLAMKGDKRVKILPHDGYRALKASLPPPERRGLVLIDPPFEDRDEFDRVATAVTDALRKWPTGTYVLWYPIKDAAAVAGFRRRLDALALPAWLELVLRRERGPEESECLQACGLFVINPPYTLQREAERLVPFLANCFSIPGQLAWHSRVIGHIA